MRGSKHEKRLFHPSFAPLGRGGGGGGLFQSAAFFTPYPAFRWDTPKGVVCFDFDHTGHGWAMQCYVSRQALVKTLLPYIPPHRKLMIAEVLNHCRRIPARIGSLHATGRLELSHRPSFIANSCFRRAACDDLRISSDIVYALLSFKVLEGLAGTHLSEFQTGPT